MKAKSRPRASALDVRTVAKGGVIQFFGMGARRASSLLFVAIAIRLLGVDGYGVYRQIAQFLWMTGTGATLGFDAALLRSIAQARARGKTAAVWDASRTAVVSVLVASTIILLFLWVAADPIAGIFADGPSRREEMTYLTRLGAAYVPLFALTQVLNTGMVGYKTVLPSVLVGSVLQPVSFLFLSTAAILAGYGVAGAVGALSVSALLSLFAASLFFRRLLRSDGPPTSGSGRDAETISSFRSMTAFALPRAGSRALVLGGAGTLVLGILGTDRDVALFTVAISLQSIVLIFPQALIGIWQPMVVDLAERGEAERLRALYQTVNRWVTSGSFGFIVALIVLPEPFVTILGGEAVQEAALLTSIIAFGTLFQVGTGPSGMLITMVGYPTINLVNSLAIVSLYALGAWLIVPDHGVVGMAVIHGAATAVSNLVLVLAAKRLTGLLPFGWSFFKPLTSTLLGGCVLSFWRIFLERSLPLDVVGIVLTGAVYVGSLWMMGMDAEDRIVYERIRARLRKPRGA